MRNRQQLVRIKVTYQGKTFRKTVAKDDFKWHQFLRWGLESFGYQVAQVSSLLLTYEDEDGDHPVIASSDDFREAMDNAARLDQPLRITMQDASGVPPPVPTTTATRTSSTTSSSQGEEQQEAQGGPSSSSSSSSQTASTSSSSSSSFATGASSGSHVGVGIAVVGPNGVRTSFMEMPG